MISSSHLQERHWRSEEVPSCDGVNPVCSPELELIDNTQRRYNPVNLKCGVTVQLGENVLRDSPDIIDIMNHDLTSCLSVLPASVGWLVKRTHIWVNRTYAYGNIHAPTVVSHSTAHHFPGWLLWVQDKAEKEASIEIYNSVEYLNLRLHYNGCGLMLHELCHIIHQTTLPGGLSNMLVIEMHKIAKESGKYSRVLRRDWALNEVDTDVAYCTLNHKEFFAEISVSYLSDFYHDVDGTGTVDMAKCSPPFVSPVVLGRMQQKHHIRNNGKSLVEWRDLTKFGRGLPHCNKFFPFTKGQLRRYDPRVYKCFSKLWQYIESWEDMDRRCKCKIGCI
eukprot:scaffold42966_cov153-Skeletonema_marinoi.AAC.1